VTTTATGDLVSELLARQRAGDAGARDELFALLYDDLRRLAARKFRRERAGHTSSPTSLVHDVYLRLTALPIDARDRRELLNLAALVMRRALVDSARRRERRALVAPGDEVEREALAADSAPASPDWNALELALEKLDRIDAELAEVVRLRFLVGLPVDEAARVLGVSEPTVKRRWRAARAWLRREVRGSP
jgi:RNA polymerase sigma factor (TIGR02999 family)